MKVITNLLTGIIIAFWIGAIAIFSIQNVTNVSLKFLTYESIQLPIGVLLAFCVAGGVIAGNFLPLLLPKKSRRYNTDY